MRIFTILPAATLVLSPLLLAAVAGCIVEPAPRRSDHYTPPPAGTGTTAPPAGTGTNKPPDGSPPPRVAIDKGTTLIVSPGEGAGVFITYPGEGRWVISWTCDTKLSGNTCPFDIAIGANNVSAYNPQPTGATVSRDAAGFRVHTDTGSTMDSVTFTTDPGASITISAWIYGSPKPSVVFFVNDGKLTTEPTDPIELVPNTP